MSAILFTFFQPVLFVFSVLFDLFAFVLYLVVCISSRLFHSEIGKVHRDQGNMSHPQLKKYGPDDIVLFMCHGSGVDSKQLVFAKFMLDSYIASETVDFVQDKQTSIEQYIDQLDDRIKELGIRKVIFLGVSMGGLVCSAWASQRNGRKEYASQIESTESASDDKKNVQVLGIVTIGTPFQGAPLLIQCNHICNKFPILKPIFRRVRTVRHTEMTPLSPFLLKLGSDLVKMQQSQNKNQRTRFLTFGSDFDFQVPNQCAQPFGLLYKHEHVELTFVGHIALSVWIPLFWRIRDFLKHVVTANMESN